MSDASDRLALIDAMEQVIEDNYERAARLREEIDRVLARTKKEQQA